MGRTSQNCRLNAFPKEFCHSLQILFMLGFFIQTNQPSSILNNWFFWMTFIQTFFSMTFTKDTVSTCVCDSQPYFLFKLLFTIASHFLPDCKTFRFKYVQLLDAINKQSYSTPNIKNPTLQFLPHRKLTPDVTISLTRSLTWTEFYFIYSTSHAQNCTILSRISSNTHREEENRTGSPGLTYFLWHVGITRAEQPEKSILIFLSPCLRHVS